MEYSDGDYTYYAWAWQAGVAMDDLIAETEEDEEDMSFKMTATAIAAATIAMVGI